MTKSKLRNKLFRCRTDENKNTCNEQRNLCLKLIIKAKKTNDNILNVKDLKDNYKFWKILKLLSTGKIMTCEKIYAS